MSVPEDYTGSKLTIIEQNPKVETTQQIIDKVLAELDPQDISNTQCAVWEKDKPDCDLTRQTIETVKARNTKLVDMKDFNDMMCKQKTMLEQKNQKTASSFTAWMFERIIEEIEDIIEEKKQVKHYQI